MSEAQTTHTMTATWEDRSDNEEGFRLERRTGAAPAPWVEVAKVGTNVQTAADMTAEIGKTYTYRVRAFNEIGDSPPSNEVTVNLLLPLAPGNMRMLITMGNAQATVSLRTKQTMK
jgi:hypothetical protein